MQIHFDKEAIPPNFSLALGFQKSELEFALALLRGIYTVTRAEFVARAIKDIQEALKPKQLPMINYWHTCVKCTRSIDERDENTMCLTRDGDSKWQCRTCKPLKKDRPR